MFSVTAGRHNMKVLRKRNIHEQITWASAGYIIYKISNLLSQIGVLAEAPPSRENLSGREIKKARRRSGWFSRTADKERDNYRGSKNLFSAFFLWEPFSLHFSPSQCALLWPDPNLIPHFTSIPDDFTVVTEH